MNKEKIREERIFEIVHCPFEGRAKLHHLCQPNGLVSWSVWWQLKRPMFDFKNYFSLDFVYIYGEKHIFPKTYNTLTISEPDFTVWSCIALKY